MKLFFYIIPAEAGGDDMKENFNIEKAKPESRKHRVIIYQIVRWHEKRKTEKTITERVRCH